MLLVVRPPRLTCNGARAYTARCAQQGKDAAEKEVQDLKRELGGKTARAEASTIETNEGMPADVGDLNLTDHCRHATRWWNRSQVELGSLEEAPEPRTGKDGYLDHPRLGLMGCVDTRRVVAWLMQSP